MKNLIFALLMLLLMCGVAALPITLIWTVWTENEAHKEILFKIIFTDLFSLPVIYGLAVLLEPKESIK